MIIEGKEIREKGLVKGKSIKVRSKILYLYVLKPSEAPTFYTYMTYMVLRKMVMGKR